MAAMTAARSVGKHIMWVLHLILLAIVSLFGAIFFIIKLIIYSLYCSVLFKPLRQWLKLTDPLNASHITLPFMANLLQTNLDKMQVSKFKTSGMSSTMHKLNVYDKANNQQTFISKSATQNLVFRLITNLLKSNFNTESSFYAHVFRLSPRVPDESENIKDGLQYLRTLTPRIYYAMDVPQFSNFLIIMEDICQSNYKCQDELKGAPLDTCVKLVECMAKVHGMFFGKEKELETYFPFLTKGLPCSMYDDAWKPSVPTFWRRFAIPTIQKQEGPTALEEHYKPLQATMEYLIQQENGFLALVNYLKSNKTPKSLAHGDFRLDNSAYRQEDDSVKILDWQIPSISTPAVDIAYFCVWASKSHTDSETELRNFHETLLRHHYKTLIEHIDGCNPVPSTSIGIEEEISHHAYTWEQYIFDFAAAVALLSGPYVLLHYFEHHTKNIVPSMRKSLASICKNYNVLEVVQTICTSQQKK